VQSTGGAGGNAEAAVYAVFVLVERGTERGLYFRVEVASPDPILKNYAVDYKWISQVYESVKPPSGKGKMLWHALGVKTIELVHENITLDTVDSTLETLILDASIIRLQKNLIPAKR